MELNAAHEALKHTVSKTKFTEPQEASRRSDFAVTSSMVVLVECTFGNVMGTVAGGVFSDDPLRRTTEVSELQMK